MDGRFEEVPAPVSQALLYVCEKCGKKLVQSEDPEQNPSRILQKTMKRMFVEHFGKKQVRPMVSSCMDVCPEGRITMALVTFSDGTTKSRFVTVAPDAPDVIAISVIKSLL